MNVNRSVGVAKTVRWLGALLATAMGLLMLPGLAAAQTVQTDCRLADPNSNGLHVAEICWFQFGNIGDYFSADGAGTTRDYQVSLPDGSYVTYTARVTGTAVGAGKGFAVMQAPTWTGSNFSGNSDYYTILTPNAVGLNSAVNSGSDGAVLRLEDVRLFAPDGSPIDDLPFQLVVADAERLNTPESIDFGVVSGGQPWEILEWLGNGGAGYNIAQSTPPSSSACLASFVECLRFSGTANTDASAVVLASNRIPNSPQPFTIMAQVHSTGGQGFAVGVRWGSVRLRKTLPNGRIASSDQFVYRLRNVIGTEVAAGTTTGTSTTAPWISAMAMPGNRLQIEEEMAPGSASSLAQYSRRVRCERADNGSVIIDQAYDPAQPPQIVIDSLQPGYNIDCEITNQQPDVDLEVAKSLSLVNGQPATAGTSVSPGDVITYQIEVTNLDATMTATLSSGAVVESIPANTTVVSAGNDFTCYLNTCSNASALTIAPGASQVLDFVVQVDDPLPAGVTEITNSVVVDGVDCAAAGNDCAEVTALRPSVEVDKASTPATGTMVNRGDTISYTLTAEVSVAALDSDLVLTDALAGGQTLVMPLPSGCVATPSGLSCTVPNGSAVGTYTFAYGTTVDDDATGSVGNAVTVPAGSNGGDPDPECTTCTTTHEVAVPELELVKTAGTPVDVNINGITDAGDTIEYSFSVTNTGNVSVENVVINDAKLSATPIACSPSTVPANGGTTSCGPVTYTVTPADVTAGSVDNSATATGTPPGGTPVTSDPSTTSTPTTEPAPDLALVKTAGTPVDVNGNGITDAGDTIDYSFEVTNTGNVPLDGVAINDAMLSATPIACSPSTVTANGGTASCGPVTYTVTPADVTNGSVDNSATATGTPPGSPPMESPPSTTTTTTTEPAPALELVKTAGTPVDVNGNGITDAGDTIDYSFSVTNTGNVPVANVVINDAKLSATPIACSPSTVTANGGTASCGPVTYTVTPADVTNGSVDNSATATGTPPGSPPVESPPSTTTTTTTAPAPALELVKTAGTPVDMNGNGITDAGDTIEYSFSVTNTGNVPVGNVVINDAKLSATPIACTPSTVTANGGTASCGPVTYTVTPTDVTNGSVDNSATATGTPPGSPPVESPPSTTTTTTTEPAPALALVKTAGTPVDVNNNGITDAGDTIEYSFSVTNTGNVPLDGVVINDAKLSATPIACAPSTLPANGDTASCGPVTYTVTPADVTAGSVDNSATATGTPPGSPPVESPPSTTTTTTTEPAPALALVKTAGTPVDVNNNGITDAGDTIAYSFEITNTGNVPLDGVVVNDAKLSATPIACSPSTVPANGGTASCGPVSYTVTPADVTAGSVDNSATATGTPPGSPPVESPPSTTTTTTTAPAPALELAKTAGTPIDVNNNGITDAGDTIDYSFEVTNTGNVPVENVFINDTMLSATPIACSPSAVPANGGTANCGPVTYTVTPADVTAGSVDNSATATGTPPGSPPVESPPSTTTTTTTEPAPALALVKTAGTPVDVNNNGITDAGDTIDYSFEVSNTGNVPVENVVINDAMLSATPIACSPSTVPAGGTASCGPVTYTVTPADVTAGSVDNSATASGTPPGSPPVESPPSTTTTTTTEPAPALALVKTAGTPVDVNGNGITDAGDTIDYSFSVTNTGNVPLDGVVINDAKLSTTPIACSPSTVPANGGTASCGPVTYTVTPADVTAGSVDNSATATGTPPGSPPVESPPSTTTTTTTESAPALSLVKTAGTPVDVNNNGITDAGDTIDYSFEVTNTGNVPLDGVVIDDAKLSATPIACSPSTVTANGGTASCGPVSYTVTPADVTAGSVDNSATATGTPPGGTPVTSNPSITNTPTTAPAPALELVKTAGTPVDVNGNGITDAGDTIDYSFSVTNTGNVPVENVVINDSKLSATPIACSPSTVPVSGTASCGPLTYTVTPADVTNGSVDNSATATGTPPGSPPVESPPSTTTTTTTEPAPALELVKTAGTPVDVNGNGITDAGDTIDYSFSVTNTGNVPVENVVINDAKLSATPISCATSTVPVGGTASCGPVTYTVTPADVTNGSVDNSATATGTPPGSPPVESPPSTTTTTTTEPAPALALVKTAGPPVDVNGNGITDAGDTIDYSFEVTNTGNVPVENVVINDSKLSATPISCAPSTVPVSGTASCGPLTYTVTPADVTNGSVDNSATATGTPPGSPPVESPPSTTTTTTTAPAPALALVKTAGTPVDVNGNGITDAGDTIDYSFSVTNTGNVPVENVVINDAKLSATPISCAPSTVPVSGTASCGPVTYTVTPADVTNGSVDNSATATGTPPGSPPVESPPSTTTTTTTAPAPALELVKTAGTPVDVNANGITDAGDTIDYSFSVTNTGNVPVENVVINDAKLSATPIACSPSTVSADGGTASCGPVTYTVTPADVTNGSVDNSATATGTPPGSPPVESPPSTTTTTTTAPAPALELVKIAGTPVDVNNNGITDAGDTIDYSFEVTNTGNVPVENVVINDAKLSATPIACSPSTVPVSGTASCGPVAYTVTPADVTSGSVDNSATATGTPPGSPPVESPPSTTTTTTTAPAPALELVKTAGTPVDVNGNGITDAGDTIAYSFEITNTGNVPLDGVVVNDAKLSATPISCAPSTVPVGGTASCGPLTYTVTPADVTAGSVDNSATATGTPPGSPPVESPPSTTTTTTTAPAPAQELVKTAGTPVDVNGNGITDAGDTIDYSFSVTNTGNVPLDGVAVNDAKLSATPISCAPATVPVGGTATCGPLTYTVTAADVTAGSVDNSATATGTPPGGTPVTSDPSTTNTPAEPVAPSLDSSKQMTGYQDADGNGAVSAGDTLTYVITVINTGNVPLGDITIADALLDPDTVTCGSVAPGTSCELAGTYVVTQADADLGSIVNTAQVTTQPPGDTTFPPEACPAGSADARCAPTVTVEVFQRPAIATTKTAVLTTDLGTPDVGNVGDVITYTVTATNTGNVTLFDVDVLDTFDGGPQFALECAPAVLAPGQMATCATYSHTVTADEANRGGTLVNAVLASGNSSGGGGPVTVTATGEANVRVEPDPTTIRIVKTASPRDVKIGDLVRYTVAVQNTGTSPLLDGVLIDTPPAGFSYVDGSLSVADDDGAGRLAGTYPMRVEQLDVAPGARAAVTYLLRVGSGVRPGMHTNSAYVEDGSGRASNVATADVQLVADPMMGESLILGTVFDDRDGDGWQDSAAMTGVRVQGGFAPGAYVAGSTTVDRGDGPRPEPDASAPLLHGIAIGDIAGRQSDADTTEARQVVVSQTLRSLDFTDDFVLTTGQGATLRMDAAGNTTLERGEGDAARGLTAAEPAVERTIAQVEDGYRVDYAIGNAGVDERGIPGVRIASVEGLLMETDQFGRYHVVGVDGGRWERGRNFILKVDTATLPPGTELTTDNPLVRRITPGLPVRFDFGARLPPGLVEGGAQPVEMELGAVLFEPGSAEVRTEYLPAVEGMAEQVREHGAGEVVIAADGESQALAYGRAQAVRDALVERLTPEQAAATTISLRAEAGDPASTLVSVGDSTVLGTFLFDTDKADIRPEYAALIDAIAADIASRGGGAIGVVGHADQRGADAYNVALGLRRAKAVYEAIAARLPQEARSRLRVDISDDPTAPAGPQGQGGVGP